MCIFARPDPKAPSLLDLTLKLLTLKLLHAQTEEEVSYPTAILIGEYVREKLRLR
jgi:hypothetical protein